MSRLLRLLPALLLILFAVAAHAEDRDPGLSHSTHDWARVAAQAERSHRPVMILFDSDDCGVCTRLKREVLYPLLREPGFIERVILAKFDIDDGGKVTDFDGARTRSRLFVGRYEVFATPTVVLLDAEGVPLTAPVIGFDNAENYRRLLAESIDRATIALAIAKR